GYICRNRGTSFDGYFRHKRGESRTLDADRRCAHRSGCGYQPRWRRGRSTDPDSVTRATRTAHSRPFEGQNLDRTRFRPDERGRTRRLGGSLNPTPTVFPAKAGTHLPTVSASD